MSEPSRTIRAQKFLIACALSLLLLYFTVCLLWFNGVAFENCNMQTASIVTGALGLLCIVLLVMSGYRLVSLPTIYLLYAWLFHFSLSFACGISPAMWDYTFPQFKDWANQPAWVASLVFSTLCFAVFSAGALFALAVSKKEAGRRTLPEQGDVFLFRAGMMIAIFCAVVLAGIIIRAGGMAILARSYMANFNEGVFDRTFRSFTSYFAFGLAFAACGAPKKRLWLPIALQLCVSAGMLLLGSRGPALVSVLVMTVILYRRGLRMRPLPAAACLLALLYVISFVKHGRDAGGLVGTTVDTAGVSAAGGLLEMGATLHTVDLMYSWIDDEPDAKQLGQTYWLPFERILGNAIPGVRQDPMTDLRVFGTAINSREPFLGGSVIGEAYYNFAIFGALLFLPMGFLFGKLEHFSSTPYKMAASAVVAYILYYYIRDYFLPVPVGIATGLIMILVIKHISPYMGLKKVAAPPPVLDAESGSN